MNIVLYICTFKDTGKSWILDVELSFEPIHYVCTLVKTTYVDKIAILIVQGIIPRTMDVTQVTWFWRTRGSPAP